jgi:hypothetical protein
MAQMPRHRAMRDDQRALLAVATVADRDPLVTVMVRTRPVPVAQVLPQVGGLVRRLDVAPAPRLARHRQRSYRKNQPTRAFHGPPPGCRRIATIRAQG